MRAAKIPFIGFVAVHCWLVVDEVDRYEVWQRAGLNDRSAGHLHWNLMNPVAGVGNGPSWCLAEFDGEAAQRIGDQLASAAERYPFCHRYRYFPGPNSNTFAQWALQGVWRLPWRAIGRGFPVPPIE